MNHHETIQRDGKLAVSLDRVCHDDGLESLDRKDMRRQVQFMISQMLTEQPGRAYWDGNEEWTVHKSPYPNTRLRRLTCYIYRIPEVRS